MKILLAEWRWCRYSITPNDDDDYQLCNKQWILNWTGINLWGRCRSPTSVIFNTYSSKWHIALNMWGNLQLYVISVRLMMLLNFLVVYIFVIMFTQKQTPNFLILVSCRLLYSELNSYRWLPRVLYVWKSETGRRLAGRSRCSAPTFTCTRTCWTVLSGVQVSIRRSRASAQPDPTLRRRDSPCAIQEDPGP